MQVPRVVILWFANDHAEMVSSGQYSSVCSQLDVYQFSPCDSWTPEVQIFLPGYPVTIRYPLNIGEMVSRVIIGTVSVRQRKELRLGFVIPPLLSTSLPGLIQQKCRYLQDQIR